MTDCFILYQMIMNSSLPASVHGWDFSGYNQISGVRYLLESNRMVLSWILNVISHLSRFTLLSGPNHDHGMIIVDSSDSAPYTIMVIMNSCICFDDMHWSASASWNKHDSDNSEQFSIDLHHSNMIIVSVCSFFHWSCCAPSAPWKISICICAPSCND